MELHSNIILEGPKLKLSLTATYYECKYYIHTAQHCSVITQMNLTNILNKRHTKNNNYRLCLNQVKRQTQINDTVLNLILPGTVAHNCDPSSQDASKE